MIEEYGTVIELTGEGIALVECAKNSACQHCAAADSCNMGSCEEGQMIRVEAINVLGAEVNDRVKVVTTTKNFLQSSLMLYIVPVISLVVGAGIGQLLGEKTPYDASLVSALLGVVFLVLTFLGIRTLTRNWQRERFMPKIVSIVNQI